MVNHIKQRARLLVCWITCYALFSSAFAQELQSAALKSAALKSADKVLHFYTEISPPYFWFDDNNQPQGVTYDLALALMANTELDGVVEQLPWARAYFEATSKPDIVLLTALRTDQREKELQWLGTVHTAQAHLVALKDNANIQLVGIEDAKKYMVGTIRGYGAADFLTNEGFTEGKNLKLLSNQRQLWSMLFKRRIDLVLDNLTTGTFAVLSAGFDSKDVESLIKIEALNVNLEMATGHFTDAVTTERLRIGLQQLKDIGTYHRIMDKWGLVE
jgi:polar amino acid transport system substrate-binding protein